MGQAIRTVLLFFIGILLLSFSFFYPRLKKVASGSRKKKRIDRNVNMAALTGANRDYILNHIPHISKLMVNSVEEVMAFADTVVIGNGAAEFKVAALNAREGQNVVDFVRIADRTSGSGYDGICW